MNLPERYFLPPKKTELLKIPKEKVSNVTYERTSRPRYVTGILLAWPLLFTKGKKHFLTIQYQTAEGKGEYALFRLDKQIYQSVLAKTEAFTGKKIEKMTE